ncbi:MAG TPA: glycoside hydrolase, partial [Pseudothermotoga sp.]
MIKKSILLFLFSAVFVFGSDGIMELLERANQAISNFKTVEKIDTRETVFAIRVDILDSKITLIGEMSDIDLKGKLISELNDILKVPIEDRITILPQSSLGEKIFAVVKIPVANLMDGPRKTSPKNVVTQARMGEIVKLLKQNGDWYL